ncbi:MAG: carboxypeptidase regulatory-like domain-containing protein [Desulfitobacteriaceae bacterium]
MSIVDDFLLKRSPAFPLSAEEEKRTDLTLSQAAPQTGRVRGRVTNSVSGSFVADATVKIRTQSGDPVSHTQTNSAGNYIIENIPPGTYTINVTLQGFLISTGQTFSILGGQTLDIDVSLTPDTQPRNTIFGIVTNLATGLTLDGAEVALIPDTGSTANITVAVSNGNGEYLIERIPDSTQSLLAIKHGFYVSSFIPISISGGTILHADISLQPYVVPHSTVNGFITKTNGQPIANACVGLYLINPQNIEILQQVTFTDANGFYIFGRAVAGTYVVKAKSEKVATAS